MGVIFGILTLNYDKILDPHNTDPDLDYDVDEAYETGIRVAETIEWIWKND